MSSRSWNSLSIISWPRPPAFWSPFRLARRRGSEGPQLSLCAVAFCRLDIRSRRLLVGDHVRVGGAPGPFIATSQVRKPGFDLPQKRNRFVIEVTIEAADLHSFIADLIEQAAHRRRVPAAPGIKGGKLRRDLAAWIE